MAVSPQESFGQASTLITALEGYLWHKGNKGFIKKAIVRLTVDNKI
jgi:hypothetical protein